MEIINILEMGALRAPYSSQSSSLNFLIHTYRYTDRTQYIHVTQFTYFNNLPYQVLSFTVFSVNNVYLVYSINSSCIIDCIMPHLAQFESSEIQCMGYIYIPRPLTWLFMPLSPSLKVVSLQSYHNTQTQSIYTTQIICMLCEANVKSTTS